MELWFKSWRRQEIFIFSKPPLGHPAFCSVGMGDPSPGVNGWDMRLTTRSSSTEVKTRVTLYLHYTICLCGMLMDSFTFLYNILQYYTPLCTPTLNLIYCAVLPFPWVVPHSHPLFHCDINASGWIILPPHPADNNCSICKNRTTLTKETATPASQQLYMEGYLVRWAIIFGWTGIIISPHVYKPVFSVTLCAMYDWHSQLF